MYILFDSNIWIDARGLNSDLGAAARYFIRQTGAVVAIPEVVRREVTTYFANDLLQHKNTILDSHGRLLAVMERLTEPTLPSDQELADRAAALVDEVDVPLKPVPFTFDAARSSLEKVLRKEPPSGPNREQFRDGVIWHNCLELLDESDVFLVTNDRDFREGRGKGNSKELAANLREEAEERNHRLTLVTSLPALLKDIGGDLDVDDESLAAGIFTKAEQYIANLLDRHGFVIGDAAPSVRRKLFVTEKASKLAVDVEVVFPCFDASGDDRTDAAIKAHGPALYDTESREVTVAHMPELELRYRDVADEEKSHRSLFLSGTVSIGPRTVVHEVRLSEGEWLGRYERADA